MTAASQQLLQDLCAEALGLRCIPDVRGPVTASGLDEMFGTPGADNDDGFAVFVVSGMLHIECLKLAARRIISST